MLPKLDVSAGLVDFNISRTAVAHLPPGLAGATSLRRLTIKGADCLRLDASDVHTLLQLTALQELLVGNADEVPEAAMRRLRRAAPHLTIH